MYGPENKKVFWFLNVLIEISRKDREKDSWNFFEIFWTMFRGRTQGFLEAEKVRLRWAEKNASHALVLSLLP